MDDYSQKAIASGINPMLVKLYNMLPNFPQQGAPVDRLAGAAVNPGGAVAEAIMPILKSIMQGLEFQQPAMAKPVGVQEEAQQIPGEGIHDWHHITPENPMGPYVPTLKYFPSRVPTYAGGKTSLPPDAPLPSMQSTGGGTMPAQMYGADQPQLPPDVTPGDIKRWQSVLGGESTVAKNVPAESPPPPAKKPAAPKPKPKPKTAAKKQVEELPWLVRGLGQQ